jgi:2-(1,2-epoxy-1,2-dihydrophenyl)acetyl-CoA isomerase
MPYRQITFEIEDRVGLIRLNRPDDGNALVPEMARELLDAAVRCDEDPEIRAVVLTGNGRMFCAGGDLKAFAAQGENVSRYIKDITQSFHAQSTGRRRGAASAWP